MDKIEIPTSLGGFIEESMWKQYYEARTAGLKPTGVVMSGRSFLALRETFRSKHLVYAGGNQYTWNGLSLFVMPGVVTKLLFSPEDAGRLAWEQEKKVWATAPAEEREP